jgi:hypothetical protein
MHKFKMSADIIADVSTPNSAMHRLPEADTWCRWDHTPVVHA